MSTLTVLKSQIEQAIEGMSQENLVRLWEYIKDLVQKEEKIPALYKLHEDAISTGVHDLAEHHDRFLYGGTGNHG